MSTYDYKSLYENIVAAIQQRARGGLESDEAASKSFLEFIDADGKGSTPGWLKAPKPDS